MMSVWALYNLHGREIPADHFTIELLIILQKPAAELDYIEPIALIYHGADIEIYEHNMETLTSIVHSAFWVSIVHSMCESC